MKCPKDGGNMKQGTAIDQAHGFAEPIWSDQTKLGVVNNFGFGLGKMRKISSFACEKCGYIEKYVQTPSKQKK